MTRKIIMIRLFTLFEIANNLSNEEKKTQTLLQMKYLLYRYLIKNIFNRFTQIKKCLNSYNVLMRKIKIK